MTGSDPQLPTTDDSETHANSQSPEVRIAELEAKNTELREANDILTQENLDLREQLANAEKKSKMDFLTELADRRGLFDALGKFVVEVQRAEESIDQTEADKKEVLGKYGVFVMIDINNFKETNDTFGHEKGDEYLVKVGKLLKRLFRGSDEISRFVDKENGEESRYGGDEFLVFVAADEDIKEIVKNRFLEALSEDEYKELKLSIGIVSFKIQDLLRNTKSPEGSSRAETLLKKLGNIIGKEVDRKLYEAKRLGAMQSQGGMKPTIILTETITFDEEPTDASLQSQLNSPSSEVQP